MISILAPLVFFLCPLLGSTKFSFDSLESFYEEYLCDQKEVLSLAKVSSPCLCGLVPYPTTSGYVTPDPILFSPQVWSFVSEPNLHPMKVTVNLFELGTSSGYVLVAPYAFSEDASIGQQGSLIMNNDGIPIWFRPTGSANLMNTDFRVQQLCGKPVLTFWQGTLVTPPAYTNAPGGSSQPGSCYYILDDTYQVIATLSARNGFTSDIHEFLLTPRNTAIFLATKTISMDLTSYGGPQNGFVQDFSIQEVDLSTNELIFFWDAIDHIPFTDSYEPASSAVDSGNVWDVYHMNSVGLTDVETDIVASSRNAWTVYRIHKPTGNIVWRLGGKQSDFTIEPGGEFSWQHDARFFSGNVVTLFDDNCCESSTIPPGTPYAHGLVLQLNLSDMTATPITTYFHDPNINVSSQGNVQSLANGNKFIGWGQSQYYSEFAGAGNTEGDPSVNFLYEVSMPGNNYTYRAYRNDWIGRPFYPPSIAIKASGALSVVFASWNGSTETVSWQVYVGSTVKRLKLYATTPKSGFETAITVDNAGPYYQVRAVNAAGVVIGKSKVVHK